MGPALPRAGARVRAEHTFEGRHAAPVFSARRQEWTRADLITKNFSNVGMCSSGRHEIKSNAPFGLWVWGWGTPETTTFTGNVSYGYPAGMNVQPINKVVIPPVPR